VATGAAVVLTVGAALLVAGRNPSIRIGARTLSLPLVLALALTTGLVIIQAARYAAVIGRPPLGPESSPVAGLVLIAALAASVLLTWWLAAPTRTLAYLLAACALPPVFRALELGQLNLVALAAVTACWWLTTKNRPVLAGLALALVAVSPRTVWLVTLGLLVAGYWRPVLIWALASLPLGGLWVLAASRHGLHNLPAALTRVNPIHLALGAPAGQMLAMAALACALLTAFRCRRRGPELPIAAALAATLLVTSPATASDLAGLLLAGWLVLRTHPPRWQNAIQLAGYVVLASLVLERTVGPPAPLVLVGILLWQGSLLALASRRRQMNFPKPILAGVRARRVVVLPAYRAEKTLRDVLAQIPKGEVDRVLLVDDASSDRTAELALELGIDVIKHPSNLGYGGNQKTCYANALLMGAEVVVMLHPDGQYDPSLVPALCQAVEQGQGDIVLGSRWLGLDPAAAGMPRWKRLGNRFLTATENRVLGLSLSEYHTGYRAYSRRFLEIVPFAENSNDFVFDTQILVQAASFGFRVAEIPAVGRYFADASSIGFRTSVVYGLKTLLALATFIGHRMGLPSRWLTPRSPKTASPRQQAAA
jgi:hypothetical protein